MRTWLIPVTLVLGGLWVWWVRNRIRSAYLTRLVRAAKGSALRARTLSLTWQLVAAVVATAMVVLAMVAQISWDAPYLRIPLLLLVIALYVPLTTLASGRDATAGKQRKVQVRKSVQQRLTEAGSTPDVTHAIISVSRPFSYYGLIVFVVATVLLTWHDT
ncbi:hypothetical protein [Luteipulveratus mongoliensis]|uniref:Uncharacterized protein n=1 Tax=Luteipulveratus mongoliensis TaxID=571913 RepID=A0A0K1JG79_9MICO|nr:hypothetical protein [Luteipulveratus mongoliensis]AKU15615.1 hypothetical protein VV02_06695 [Luteipulveratus mongoliensis]